jgi:hypothetical protein
MEPVVPKSQERALLLVKAANDPLLGLTAQGAVDDVLPHGLVVIPNLPLFFLKRIHLRS